MSNSDMSDSSLSIDAVKKATEIPPIQALLTPTAELLGLHLRNKLERWLYSKKKENIERHASAVLNKDEFKELSDQSQIDLFEWAENAQNITEEEVELTSSIRAALRETLNNNRENASILNNLNRSEILFLTKDIRDDYAERSLLDKGLVRKITDISYISDQTGKITLKAARYTSIGIFTLIILIALFLIYSSGIFVFFELVNNFATTAFRNIIIISALFAFPLFMLFISARKTIITTKGEEIRKLINTYLDDDFNL